MSDIKKLIEQRLKENPERQKIYDDEKENLKKRLEKLKLSAVRVEEKDGKIILDSKNKKDLDWFAD